MFSFDTMMTNIPLSLNLLQSTSLNPEPINDKPELKKKQVQSLNDSI